MIQKQNIIIKIVNIGQKQKAYGPKYFADVITCHKMSSYYGSLVQTGNICLKSLLTKSQMPAM